MKKRRGIGGVELRGERRGSGEMGCSAGFAGDGETAESLTSRDLESLCGQMLDERKPLSKQ